MKKFITLALLASSIVIVGCNNSGERTAMQKILDYIGDEFGSFPAPCPGGEDNCPVNLSDFSIVDESAEGDNRVVIKRWIEGDSWMAPCHGAPLIDTNPGNFGPDKSINKDGCICLVNTDVDEILAQVEGVELEKMNKDSCWTQVQEQGRWEYWGVEFPEKFDIDKIIASDNVENFILDYFTGSFRFFGRLKYEPADNEFFYHGKNLFSETTGSLKDLELMGAKVEANNSLELGEKLAAQYGLSAERGLEVAKTISVYNKLTSKRALTPSEMDNFTNKLLGVNYKDAEEGIKSGDQDDFNALMERAAETNGTSPEAMTAIIKDMVL